MPTAIERKRRVIGRHEILQQGSAARDKAIRICVRVRARARVCVHSCCPPPGALPASSRRRNEARPCALAAPPGTQALLWPVSQRGALLFARVLVVLILHLQPSRQRQRLERYAQPTRRGRRGRGRAAHEALNGGRLQRHARIVNIWKQPLAALLLRRAPQSGRARHRRLRAAAAEKRLQAAHDAVEEAFAARDKPRRRRQTTDVSSLVRVGAASAAARRSVAAACAAHPRSARARPTRRKGLQIGQRTKELGKDQLLRLCTEWCAISRTARASGRA
jgi:hypothetical protein